jgi:hypothetical protein
MTAPFSIDPTRFLHEQLGSASPDLLRQMLTTFMNTLMSAKADAVCGAPYGESSPERTNVRNGYRHREFDIRAGTLEVAIPKLREGSYFPDWPLERRRRAERALTIVVATCYLLGVSTRRMEKLVDALGITRLSKSQVSVMAAELDATVAEFRGRPLDQGPYTFVAADALVLKVREGGRVVNVHALVATGVNAEVAPVGDGVSCLRRPVSATISTPPGSPRCSTTQLRKSSRTPSASQFAEFSSRCIPSPLAFVAFVYGRRLPTTCRAGPSPPRRSSAA